MKLNDLTRHLRQHRCHLEREGRSHSIWQNPATGAIQPVPRHTEIDNLLAQEICRKLSIPPIARQPQR